MVGRAAAAGARPGVARSALGSEVMTYAAPLATVPVAATAMATTTAGTPRSAKCLRAKRLIDHPNECARTLVTHNPAGPGQTPRLIPNPTACRPHS
ncbi:hypothetical protein GCM10023191_084210 [Actinoallomurus oryzae]|uniref:Secreted protein n=1 Tax=Actinoallomurus oryzae TaxID=502180 RepID=A0ABP8R0H5_9ACTN